MILLLIVFAVGIAIGIAIGIVIVLCKKNEPMLKEVTNCCSELASLPGHGPEKKASSEYTAFTECYADILLAIQSPDHLANILFSQHVIDSIIKNKVHLNTKTPEEKGETLLDAVEQAIRADPHIFHVFTWALHQENTSGVHKVCLKLEKAYDRHSNTQRKQMARITLPKQARIQNQLCVCVSNYKPLQIVITVNDPKEFAKYPDLPLRKEETFNPIVTVIDYNTGQPIRCIFNGAHDQPKHTNEMCCYLSVEVDLLPFIHHDRKRPTYGVRECAPTDEEACELSLLFCFCRANSDYIITFSVDRITNAEGFKCFGYSADSVTCVVHTVTQKQYNASTQFGMLEEMPLIEFSSPCVGKHFDEFGQKFLNLIFQGNQYDAVAKLALETTNPSSKQPPDLQVVALSFWALQLSRDSRCNQEACAKLEEALKISNRLECKNGLLLQGRILRYYSAVYRQQRNLEKARELIDRAKSACFSAHPSYDTTNILCEEAALLEDQHRETMTLEIRRKVEFLWNLGIAHSQCIRGHERPVLCLIYTRKATFHLKSFQVSLSKMHKLPNLRPSKQDIQIAEACLSKVPFSLLDATSTYKVHYYLAKSDLHFWKNQYREAFAFADAAHAQSKLVETSKSKILKERLDLLAELKS